MAYRVAVWGTGNVGQPALRTVIANPALELAGVIVSAKDKVGRDAGELCGLSQTGIVATNDAESVLASGDIDAVAYCASGDFRPSEALDELEQCLRAGANVVSTAAYPLYDPTSAPPDIRDRFSAACTAGDSSMFVSGVGPGYINDIVPLMLSGLCEEIEEIRSFEIFNYATYYAPDAVRNLVGFGMPMEEAGPRFEESLDVLTRAWTTDEPWSHDGEFWNFKNVIVEPPTIQKPHPPFWMGAGSPTSSRGWKRW